MPLTEVPIEQFGGLNLIGDPGEVANTGAVSLLNVDFDQLGRVKTRQGFVRFTVTPNTTRFDALHAFGQPTGPDIIVASAGAQVAAFQSGVLTHSTTGSGGPHSFTSYGTATEPRVYFTNGVDVLRYYTTAGFTTPSTSGVTTVNGRFVATQQPDNRLVVARFPAERSRVRFSDPGDPHTFGTDNYVDLTPGDGEEITGVCSWRDYVFVFKESKFFVFYGNDIDTTGEPVFNYRGVYGAGVRFGGTVTPGLDGVYFLDRRGVFRTTGGQPQLISRVVEPLFAPISDTTPDRIDGASGATPWLHWSEDRLYLAYSTGSAFNNRVLVHHTQDGWWSVWDVPASAFCSARTSATDPLEQSLLFAYSTGDHHLGRFTNALTDDGAPIRSHYQFGFMDFGDSAQKVLRRLVLDGDGLVNVAVGVNYRPPGAGSSVLMRSVPTGRGYSTVAYRGHNFSPRIGSVDGSSWRVNRLVCAVRSRRPLTIEHEAA